MRASVGGEFSAAREAAAKKWSRADAVKSEVGSNVGHLSTGQLDIEGNPQNRTTTSTRDPIHAATDFACFRKVASVDSNPSLSYGLFPQSLLP